MKTKSTICFDLQAEQERWQEEVDKQLIREPKKNDAVYMHTTRDSLNGVDRAVTAAAAADIKQP